MINSTHVMPNYNVMGLSTTKFGSGVEIQTSSVTHVRPMIRCLAKPVHDQHLGLESRSKEVQCLFQR